MIEYIPQATSFLFVFAVVYALLHESGVIKLKNANVIIAAVFGIFAAMYKPFTEIMQVFMPLAAVVFIMVFFLLVIRRVFKGESRDALPSAAGLVIMLILVGVFWNQLASYVPFYIGTENLLYIIGIIIIAFIFYAVYSHGGS